MAKSKIDLTVTDGMKIEARRGLAWRKEYKRGGTAVGVARARSIIGNRLTRNDWIEINAWHARHAVDAEAEGYRPGEDGYPSAGRIAAALWGGQPAKQRAAKIRRQIEAENDN